MNLILMQGMVAFRTKFPATSELPAEAANTEGLPRRERRKRLRKFFAGRDEACFFTDTTVTLAQAKTELQNRVAVCIFLDRLHGLRFTYTGLGTNGNTTTVTGTGTKLCSP